MVGWMDDVALHRTLTTGRTTFFSRSRGEYWVKGETSGHRQWVREVRLDCDGDTLLVKVTRRVPPATPATAAASTPGSFRRWPSHREGRAMSEICRRPWRSSARWPRTAG